MPNILHVMNHCGKDRLEGTNAESFSTANELSLGCGRTSISNAGNKWPAQLRNSPSRQVYQSMWHEIDLSEFRILQDSTLAEECPEPTESDYKSWSDEDLKMLRDLWRLKVQHFNTFFFFTGNRAKSFLKNIPFMDFGWKYKRNTPESHSFSRCLSSPSLLPSFNATRKPKKGNENKGVVHGGWPARPPIDSLCPWLQPYANPVVFKSILLQYLIHSKALLQRSLSLRE